jgi:transposase-like protein
MISKNSFKSVLDLVQAFPTEQSCHHYLASQRWGDGYMECLYDDCDGDDPYVFKDGIRYKCKCCKRIYTAKTGTAFEASKLPLIKWFIAIYLFMHKKGISSVQLAKDVGVQQKTAWFMLHRIREVMGNEPDKQPMQGTVEVDETFVGGKNKNRHYHKRVKYKEVTGRAYPDKVPVFGLYERETGRIRAMAISRTQFSHIGRTITRNVWPGSTLMTDEWMGYRGVDKMYTRFKVDHKRWIYASGDVTTNRVENFWSHLKRGLHGTYIQVSPKHLNKYVQEFVFRFNHRTFDTETQIKAALGRSECRLKLKDLKAHGERKEDSRESE